MRLFFENIFHALFQQFWNYE